MEKLSTMMDVYDSTMSTETTLKRSNVAGGECVELAVSVRLAGGELVVHVMSVHCVTCLLRVSSDLIHFAIVFRHDWFDRERHAGR